MSRRKKTAGLTVMDTLVVIGAIGLLLAVAVPLTLRSREADRRNSCVVKLKNIAIAFHTYHDNFQKFPSSAFYKEGQNLGDKDFSLKTVAVGHGGQGPKRTPYSFLVKLFPYFQKNDLYDQINFRSDEAFDAPNFKLAATQVPLFRCPSYQGQKTSMAPDYAPPPGVGRLPLRLLSSSKPKRKNTLLGGMARRPPYLDFIRESEMFKTTARHPRHLDSLLSTGLPAESRRALSRPHSSVGAKT
ncbi:MAG: DUF1559 domain-containing protein [Planctomycetes bacterium]|nr:DUF1559 domain-containing protein [Planctomycetota bacterium]